MYSETTAAFLLGTATLWRREAQRVEEWKVCCTYSEGRHLLSDDEAEDSFHDDGEAVVCLCCQQTRHDLVHGLF
jgi:hypothetical protein